MANFFRGRAVDGAAKLEKELANLEKQVNTASPGYETQFLNRAGNLCVESGEPKRALGYFGRAIDAYLESGRFGAAEVLCRKVLSIAPEAVRARCTLAWLAIGRGVTEPAQREIEQYVDAAQNAGQQHLAGKQLLMMAEAATDPELRERIAHHLLRLGAAQEADRAFGMLYQSRERPHAPAMPDEGKLWAKLLRAALMGPRELQQQSWGHGEEEGDGLPSLVQDENA